MSAQVNQATVELARQHFNAGEIEAYLSTLYAPDCIAHFLPPGMPQGHTGLRLFYSAFITGFPDARLHFDDMLSDGDDLAVRYHLDATNRGDFNGIPATGKRISIPGITVMRFVDGRVVERWSHADFLGLMQQLGVVPALTAG